MDEIERKRDVGVGEGKRRLIMFAERQGFMDGS